MLALLLILIIIACCLLVVIILAQNPKGGGLSNIGAGASQFLGARQTADFLEKSTWYFGIGILVVVMITYFLTTNTAGPDKTLKTRTEGVDYTIPSAPKQKAKEAPAQQAAPTTAPPAPAGGNSRAPAGAQTNPHTPPTPPVPPK